MTVQFIQGPLTVVFFVVCLVAILLVVLAVVVCICWSR